MKRKLLCCTFAVVFLGASIAAAQEARLDKITVTLSDPSRPASVRAHVLSGGITVRGYDGKDVIVQSVYRGARSSGHRSAPGTEGMKRIDNPNTGLEITEENNVVNIETGAFNRPVDLEIQVPRRTSLNLKSVNDGDIQVENVQGEIEVQDLNGRVKLLGISGSAVVHALNGEVTAVLTDISPGKPMSFSSMNGTIDVTFPPTLKANVVMQSQNGDIYTDFDVKMDARASDPVIEDARGKGGKYKVRIDKAVRGTINGGGPEIMFKTFNGDIFIRKASAK